jgi:hypothetical protein
MSESQWRKSSHSGSSGDQCVEVTLWESGASSR